MFVFFMPHSFFMSDFRFAWQTFVSCHMFVFIFVSLSPQYFLFHVRLSTLALKHDSRLCPQHKLCCSVEWSAAMSICPRLPQIQGLCSSPWLARWIRFIQQIEVAHRCWRNRWAIGSRVRKSPLARVDQPSNTDGHYDAVSVILMLYRCWRKMVLTLCFSFLLRVNCSSFCNVFLCVLYVCFCVSAIVCVFFSWSVHWTFANDDTKLDESLLNLGQVIDDELSEALFFMCAFVFVCACEESFCCWRLDMAIQCGAHCHSSHKKHQHTWRDMVRS